MRAFSLKIGDIISFPEEGLTLEVLDVQEDEVRLGVVAPFLPESNRDSDQFLERILLLDPTLT